MPNYQDGGCFIIGTKPFELRIMIYLHLTPLKMAHMLL